MRRGIATLEVLAVGGIITLSAAAVAPVFTASEHAKTMKCAANGKKVLTALLQYMSDYDGRFPGMSKESRLAVNDRLARITWKYLWGAGSAWEREDWSASQMAVWRYYYLKKYVGDDDVWICPHPNSEYAKRYAYGYRISWMLRGSDGFVNGDRGFQKTIEIGTGHEDYHTLGLTISEVQALDSNNPYKCGNRHMPPHKKIMIMCYGLGTGVPLGQTGTWPWIFPAYPHEGGSNFGYADGHVECKIMGEGWAPLGYTGLRIDQ